MTAVDAPLTGAEESAVLTEFEAIFADANKCPCCGNPLPAAVFGYDASDGAQ